MNTKKVFIYGASGFIGSSLKKILKDKKLSILNYKKNSKAINYDKNYYIKFWKHIIKDCEAIVYAYFNNDLNELNKDPRLSLSRTLLPLFILTEVIKDSKKKIKVIYLSSASVYGNQKTLPVDEKRKTTTNNLYDNLKILSEQILLQSNIKNMNYFILRLSNVYGENLSKLSQKNRQIISKIIKNALIQKTINVYGHGKYFRDYVHVKDVCMAIYRAILSKGSTNQIFNIGSGRKVKLIWIFELVRKIIKQEYGINVKINRIRIKNQTLDNIRNYQSSIKKAKKILNWKPFIKLELGVTDLINFIYNKNLKKKNFGKNKIQFFK